MIAAPPSNRRTDYTSLGFFDAGTRAQAKICTATVICYSDNADDGFVANSTQTRTRLNKQEPIIPEHKRREFAITVRKHVEEIQERYEKQCKAQDVGI